MYEQGLPSLSPAKQQGLEKVMKLNRCQRRKAILRRVHNSLNELTGCKVLSKTDTADVMDLLDVINRHMELEEVEYAEIRAM